MQTVRINFKKIKPICILQKKKNTLREKNKGIIIIIQGDIAIVNVYTLNARTLNYSKQILMYPRGSHRLFYNNNGGLQYSTFINGRINQTEANKGTAELIYSSDQKDLINRYRTFHPTAAECTLFSQMHETFSMIYHMLGHKTSLNQIFKNEIMSCIFFTAME